MIFSVFYECQLDAGEWALLKPPADRVSSKPNNNHELTDTGFLGAKHDVLQQWLAMYLNQRLRNCARRRDKPAAVTGGQDQALVYFWHLSPSFVQGWLRLHACSLGRLLGFRRVVEIVDGHLCRSKNSNLRDALCGHRKPKRTSFLVGMNKMHAPDPEGWSLGRLPLGSY